MNKHGASLGITGAAYGKCPLTFMSHEQPRGIPGGFPISGMSVGDLAQAARSVMTRLQLG